MSIFFFFNDTATTEIYTLSLHDALPIWAAAGESRRSLRGGGSRSRCDRADRRRPGSAAGRGRPDDGRHLDRRSEEHTSELQSRLHLVCRLLLEKKKI